MTREQGCCSCCRWSTPCQFLVGDGGRWWLSLAKDRALAATAHHDPITNPQLLLIVIFLHRFTRRHKWLYLLMLKIMPGLRAEQHSGNCRCVRQRVEVNPPNGRASTKEEGGGTLSGQGTVVVMLATALLSLAAGGWPPSMLAALSRPLPSAAAAVALGTSLRMCWHNGGAGRRGCCRGGVPYFLQLLLVWCKFPKL